MAANYNKTLGCIKQITENLLFLHATKLKKLMFKLTS